MSRKIKMSMRDFLSLERVQQIRESAYAYTQSPKDVTALCDLVKAQAKLIEHDQKTIFVMKILLVVLEISTFAMLVYFG